MNASFYQGSLFLLFSFRHIGGEHEEIVEAVCVGLGGFSSTIWLCAEDLYLNMFYRHSFAWLYVESHLFLNQYDV